jgi:alkaline phosphatase D
VRKALLPRTLTAAALVAAVFLSLGAGDAKQQPLSRIAFGSCSDQKKQQPVWDAVLRFKPDIFVFLGDNIYADTDDMGKLKAEYSRFARVEGFEALRKSTRILATWDDHDYGLPDGGAEFAQKAESKEIFLDFFGEPKDSPRRKRPGVYDAQIIGPPGKRIQFILLDARYNRSPLKKAAFFDRAKGPYRPNTDPDSTLLGEEQWRFLEAELQKPAEIRFLCSSIQFVADDHGFEKWGNFPHERQRLIELITKLKVSGLIILSGDRHLGELSSMDAGIGYLLYDLTSSGLNQAIYNLRPLEHNDRRIGTVSRVNNFGAILVDWGRPNPRITLQIQDEEGDVRLAQKLDLSELQFWKPTPTPSVTPIEARGDSQ